MGCGASKAVAVQNAPGAAPTTPTPARKASSSATKIQVAANNNATTTTTVVKAADVKSDDASRVAAKLAELDEDDLGGTTDANAESDSGCASDSEHITESTTNGEEIAGKDRPPTPG